MAEVQGLDPTKVGAEEFAALVARADDDQIGEVVRAVGTAEVLDRIFDQMQERFRPDKAQGVDAKVQFVITDEGAELPYGVSILGGACTATSGRLDDPKVTITTDVVSFAKLVAGKAEGPQLFMSGKLKLSGDIMFSARVMSFFDRPQPA